MSEVQKPSVGRVVHFYSTSVDSRGGEGSHGGFNGVGAGPYLAHVTQTF